MAYPFMQFPTLDEFIDLVCSDHGCTLEQDQDDKYLKRMDGNTPRVAVIPPGIQGRDHIISSQIRSFCKQLGIVPTLYGINWD